MSISSGSVNDSIFGGDAYNFCGATSATGNTVTISGPPTFNTASELVGGEGFGLLGADADFFSGNHLNISNYTGGAVSNVKNFK